MLGHGEQINAEYVYTGKVKLIYVAVLNHSRSLEATQAAFCAGAQGKFWVMHKRLFQAYNDLWTVNSVPALNKQLAAELKLDTAKFNQCIDGKQMEAAAKASDARYRAAKLRGQPWFTLNGGAAFSSQPWEKWQELLNKAIGGT